MLLVEVVECMGATLSHRGVNPMDRLVCILQNLFCNIFVYDFDFNSREHLPCLLLFCLFSHVPK